MKKKITSLALIVALAAIAIVGASLAYFTDTTGPTTNTFTFGKVSIELLENWQEPVAVLPGIAYPKEPWVENDGTNEAWVRMHVTITATDILLEAAKDKIDGFTVNSILDGVDTAHWTLAATQARSTTEITYTYHYNDIVGTAQDANRTTPLFTSVTIPKEFTSNDFRGLEAFEIVITADAIQTSDAYSTVEDAFKIFDAQ